jgi:hypothetical protein
MKETLEVINRMRANGVIGQYAIGGAVGATFYIEPAATFDIDIFLSFQDLPPSSFISLDKIYNYLRPLGYLAQGEHIMIEGWKVQFLPAPDALCEEALEEAVETDLDGVPTRVMRAEHLMAIALKTGRAKDFWRIEQFVSDHIFDAGELARILEKHGLVDQWKAFNRKHDSTK